MDTDKQQWKSEQKAGNMSNVTSPLTTETETLREAYAALNRGDIPGFVERFDDDIEWVEFAESPDGGTYNGRAAIEAHATQARGTWAEGSCEPERFIVAGDKVIVFVHVRVRLKNETDWREGRIADVYTFRNGKSIHVRLFLDRRQALEWAGAEVSDVD
jgi:ketosteroid isomerase-like protein